MDPHAVEPVSGGTLNEKDITSTSSPSHGGSEKQQVEKLNEPARDIVEDNHTPNKHGDKAGEPGCQERSPDGMDAESGLSRSTSSRQSGGGNPPTQLNSRMSVDPQGNTYPEGGTEAYLVVLGAFLTLFGSLGLSNTLGSFQAYISANQLKDHDQSSISWIFGIYTFLMFFAGIQVGPIFDAKGPKILTFPGTILTIASIILLGFCQEYYQFILGYALLGGIGVSLVYTPAFASPGHFFYRLRGRATGLAATGGSVGGIAFPLMVNALIPKIGFAWATRCVALVCLIAMGSGLVLLKSRLPKKKATRENILPDLRILLEPQMALATAGVFFTEWAIFIPITYITSYGLDHHLPRALSFQLLSFLNVGSFFGRWIPGFLSDYTGRFNMMMMTVLMCLVSLACLWLPAGDSPRIMIAFAVIYGFASGSNISLAPVCVGQVCKTEHYGRYYATSYTVVSFGTLTGVPIAGSILTRNGGEYWGLITFTCCCYVAAIICFQAGKVLKCGWNPMAIY